VPEYPLLREAGVLIAYVQLINGKRKRLVRLAVDTGATTTMIPPRAALAIGLHPERSTHSRETLTASGKELIPIIAVPQLKVFEKTLHHVTVACHELPSESPIDGLLGLNVLIPLRAVLDLGAQAIRIPD